MKRKQWIMGSSIISLAVLGAVVLFPFSKSLELKTEDFRSSLFEKKNPDVPLVLVSIDDPSFEAINIRWPWPRQIFARALERLKRADARVVAMDVMLGDRGYNDREDLALEKAIASSGRVVLPSKLGKRESHGYQIDYLDLPLERFSKRAKAVGFINLIIDPDGAVRRIVPFDNTQGETERAFAVAVLETYSGKRFKKVEEGFSNGDYTISLPPGRPVSIHYLPGGSFRSVPFYRLLDPKFDMSLFKDKIVVMGAAFKESHDLFLTPVETQSGLYGVEVHANAIDTIYSGEIPQNLSSQFNLLILCLLILFASVLFVRVRPVIGFIWMLAGVAALLGISVYLYYSALLYMNLFDPILSLNLSWIGSLVFNFLVVDKEKRRMRGLFSRYMAPEVVNSILKSESSINLGGEVKEVVVFFSDICGFTPFSEKLSPPEVVEMLNEYFTEMIEIVFKYRGTFDKYIGDALMAFYGAPLPVEKSSEKALRACLEMRAKLAELNLARESQGKSPIKIGMGLHKGEVLVGNIGSLRQMEYTVIGDTVNLCSRIEGLTRTLDTDLLISEEVYSDVKDMVDVIAHPSVPVKGKSEKITVYSVIGLKGDSI